MAKDFGVVLKDGGEASKVPLIGIASANASEGALILHVPKGSLKLSDVRYIRSQGMLYRIGNRRTGHSSIFWNMKMTFLNGRDVLKPMRLNGIEYGFFARFNWNMVQIGHIVCTNKNTMQYLLSTNIKLNIKIKISLMGILIFSFRAKSTQIL